MATAIINVWTADPDAVARSFQSLVAAYGNRVLLGIGASHPEAVGNYARPYDRLVGYLDRLDAGGVPAGQRIIGALGDRSLRLGAARAAGAHPYLVVPAHTEHARTLVGPGPLVVPEHKVVVEADPVRARGIGRPYVQNPYLGLRNYTNNLLRYGFTSADIAEGGSDRLIDALVLHGSPDAVESGLRQHCDAGADHVAVQVLGESVDEVTEGYRTLAPVLLRGTTGQQHCRA